jgi:hypothetical protein
MPEENSEVTPSRTSSKEQSKVSMRVSLKYGKFLFLNIHQLMINIKLFYESRLTSEDTGAYGRDIGKTLPDLLWRLVEVIPENCRLRLGMTNPPYILDHLVILSWPF